MKRYLPYLKLFKPVRWHLAGGIVAGLFFAVATGAGIPLATKTIFPLIFPSIFFSNPCSELLNRIFSIQLKDLFYKIYVENLPFPLTARTHRKRYGTSQILQILLL